VRTGLIGVTLLPLVLLAISGSAFAEGTATRLAAHRGGAALWPENSRLAFRNAVGLGADYLEFDVHLSRDGEVVVIHDPTLDRTTTGTGPVKDRTLAELRALRLRDRSGAVTDETVPTLDEVVTIAKSGGRRLLLEIKVDAGRTRYAGIEERVLAVLDRHGMGAATVIMAFERDTWGRIRALRPDIQAGALYSARSLQSGSAVVRAIEDAREAGVLFVGLAYPLVTGEAVAAARSAGVTLGAWTVNDPDLMRLVVQRGVSVLITDRPDVGLDVLTNGRKP